MVKHTYDVLVCLATQDRNFTTWNNIIKKPYRWLNMSWKRSEQIFLEIYNQGNKMK